MAGSIQKQLEQCNYADLSNYDASTRTYHIPKYTRPQFQLNKSYLVVVSPEIVGNVNTVLATNWNNGSAPQYASLVIYISNVIGKNIYVDARGYDLVTRQPLDYMWSGWLCVDQLTLIQCF